MLSKRSDMAELFLSFFLPSFYVTSYFSVITNYGRPSRYKVCGKVEGKKQTRRCTHHATSVYRQPTLEKYSKGRAIFFG